jgi:flagellar basal-body rod protein FlgF
MANTGTIGFKREQPLFHEYVERADAADVPDAKNTSFVLDYGAVHDTAQGAFQATGRPLDVMIDGPGYLSVETPDGTTAYTRAGSIKVLDSGDLGTAQGFKFLDEGGRPIAVPPDQAARLTIAEDGTVLGAQGALGRLAVSRFDDEAGLDPRGDGLMAGTGARLLTAQETKLKSGGLEGSNVQPIVETTAMVEILRSYQASQRMSESINDMRRQAIEKLGRSN